MTAHHPRTSGRWAAALAPAAALLISISLAGCYTILQHPRGTDLADGKPSGSCLRCHSADGGFDSGSVPWVDYYSYSSYPWINYYGSPWWYDSYWDWHDDCDDCEEDSHRPGETPSLSGRQAWGRKPRGEESTSSATERERTSSALAPIVAPPAAAPVTVPAPAGTDNGTEEEKPDGQEEKEEPRGRIFRR